MLNINTIRAWGPCYDPIKYLPEDWQGTIRDIAGMENVPIEDRIWCAIKTLSKCDQRLFACWCAREALALIDSPDPRSIAAVEVAERYAHGEATKDELDAARYAAWDAAWATAKDAAKDAARYAAKAAAKAAAAYTAWNAAKGAAWAAAKAAAAYTAWNAAKGAAWATAKAAAGDAADAAWNAGDAADAAWNAADAAGDAARRGQLTRLVEMSQLLSEQ